MGQECETVKYNMTKFTSYVLCAVALSLSSVYAVKDKNIAALEDMGRLINECLREHGVTDAEFQDSMKTGDVSMIKPCFWGCYFKKLGYLNENGQFDLNTGLTNYRKFLRKGDLTDARMEQAAKQCETVKDKAVSDGEAGCERGALLAACFLKHENKQ